MAKETAEQKLLKLIESAESQEKAAVSSSPHFSPSQEAQKVLDSVKGLPTVSELPAFLSPVVAAMKDPAVLLQKISSLGLKEINKLLLIGIIILVAFLSMDFSKGMKLSEQKIHFAVPENIHTITENLMPSIGNLKEYMELVIRRNIFHPFERKAVEEEVEISDEKKAVQRVTEQTRDLKLVGVSWLETPDSASAMVENTKTGVTYFLKTGEQINGVEVKIIYSDSIVVVYQNQEMEMHL